MVNSLRKENISVHRRVHKFIPFRYAISFETGHQTNLMYFNCAQIFNYNYIMNYSGHLEPSVMSVPLTDHLTERWFRENRK